MKPKHTLTINSISEFHKISGFPKPEHPLVSLVDYSKVNYQTDSDEISWIQNFYSVGLKRNMNGKFKYGQQQYDFDEGLMSFVSPGQLINLKIEPSDPKPTGMLLFFHPDFLWNTPLAKNIKHYNFFGYAVNEALFMSDKEEKIIEGIMQDIEQEYHANIDKHSQGIIIAQIEQLLNYCDRFYQRQFVTRKITNHQILEKLEDLLDHYFNSEELTNKGLPTVQDISSKLNLSPNYLSNLLQSLTNQSTQQHIHDKFIAKAKEMLSTTQLSVSEVAYQMGFEYPQSFSKLFKSKTNFSPVEFRASFN